MKILVKEAAEEASIPEELCSVAKFVGTLEFSRHAGGSLQPEKEFIFDIELPADFQDGKRFFRYWTHVISTRNFRGTFLELYPGAETQKFHNFYQT